MRLIINKLGFSALLLQGCSSYKHRYTWKYLAPSQALAALLNRIYGTTLQMQRESQWFKEVERIIRPTIIITQYKDSLITEELFIESHKRVNEGRREMDKGHNILFFDCRHSNCYNHVCHSFYRFRRK